MATNFENTISDDTLAQVTNLLKTSGFDLQAVQGTIAAATIGGRLVATLEAGTYDVELRAEVGTTGTAGSTTIQVHLNGVAISGAEVTVANTDADGTKAVAVATSVVLAAADTLELVVSAAPTAGADIVTSAKFTTKLTS